MTTKHPVTELTAYIDGALAPAERVLVEAHLTACQACRLEHARLARAVAVLASLPRAIPSPSFCLLYTSPSPRDRG